MPAVAGSATTTFTPGVSGTYVTFDITGLVQGWVTTPASNYGIALTSASGNVLLDSKENDQTGHAASLNVTVTSMGPQGIPGTNGTNGATGSPGPQGPSGPTGPAGAAAGGVWSSSTAYVAGSVVTYNGATYLATASTSLAPTTPTWTSTTHSGSRSTAQRKTTSRTATGPPTHPLFPASPSPWSTILRHKTPVTTFSHPSPAGRVYRFNRIRDRQPTRQPCS